MALVTNVLRQVHGISHAAKLVLLAISAYVEEHGAPVYPSQATLAQDAGITERYIEACVQECEASGYLQVERRRVAGKRPRNFYTVCLIGQTIPEASSGKPVPRSQFPEASSVEKKERKDLQEHRDRGSQFPETRSPKPMRGLVQHSPAKSLPQTVIPMHPPALLTPEGERWARAHHQPHGIASQACGLETQETAGAGTLSPRPHPPRKYFFDAKRLELGDPCPDDPTHRYGDTGQSLRVRKNQRCEGCRIAARQAAHRQAQG